MVIVKNEDSDNDEVLDKKMVVEKLIDESYPHNSYYFLLIISALITTLGLLIDSVAVVIGGMLISPLMTPLLSLGLSIITNNQKSVVWSLANVSKSVGIVFVVSFITGFIVGVKDPLGNEILSRSQVELPYLYIAILSGVAATYAWARPKISASLPGIAVAIALLPPLCVSGIGLSIFSKEIMTGSLQLFFVNIFGIIASSTVIFSLLGFHDMKHVEDVQIMKEEIEEELQKNQSDK